MDATERALRAALRHRHQAAALAVALPAFVGIPSSATSSSSSSSVTRSDAADVGATAAQTDSAGVAELAVATATTPTPSPLNLHLPHDLELHREGWKSNDPRFICEQERKVRARKKALREQRERERAVASLQAAAAAAALTPSFVPPTSSTATDDLAHLSARKLMDALGPAAFEEALQACSTGAATAAGDAPPAPSLSARPPRTTAGLDDFILTVENVTMEGDSMDLLAPIPPEDEAIPDASPDVCMELMLQMPAPAPVAAASASETAADGFLDESLASAGLHLDLLEMPPEFHDDSNAMDLASTHQELALEDAIAAMELEQPTANADVVVPELLLPSSPAQVEAPHVAEPLPLHGELPSLPTTCETPTGAGDAGDAGENAPVEEEEEEEWLKAFDEPWELDEAEASTADPPPPPQTESAADPLQVPIVPEAAGEPVEVEEEEEEEETEELEAEGQVALPSAAAVGASAAAVFSTGADAPVKKKCGRGRIDPEQKQQNRRKTREAHSLIRRNKILANQASKKLRECIERVQVAHGEMPVGMSSSSSTKKKKKKKRSQGSDGATATTKPGTSRSRSTEPPSRRTKKVRATAAAASAVNSGLRPNRPMPLPSLPLAIQQRFISDHTRAWFSRTGDIPMQQQQEAQQLPTSFHPDILTFHVSAERSAQVLPTQATASDPHLEQMSQQFDKAVALSSMRATVRHVQANDSATWLARAWSDSLLTVDAVRGPSLLHHATFDTRGLQITCSAWSTAATHLATGTTRGDVLAFDVQCGRPFASPFVRVPKHGGSASRSSIPVVWDVQWCHRDAYLSAGYDDGICALFRCDASNTPLRLFSALPAADPSGDEASACCVTRFHPSYCYLLTGLRNGRVTLWDCNANVPAFTMQLKASQSGAQLADVAFSSDGAQVVLASDSGHLELWDLASARPIDSFPRAPPSAHRTNDAPHEPLANSMLETIGTVTPASTHHQRYRIHWANDDAVVAHVHPAGVVQCFDTRFPQQHEPVVEHALRPAIRTASVLAASRAVPPRRVLSSGFTTRNVLTLFYS
jgi:WD40 repeat protein